MNRTFATIAGCAALVAGCGQDPQPGAKAFNARQEAIRRDVEARSRVRIVAPPNAVNGGYAAMPGDLPRAAPTAVGTGTPRMTDETSATARDGRDAGPPATSRPTRMGRAALARAVAAAERRRVETMSTQDASLRRAAAEARTRQKARDIAVARRFRPKVSGPLAPAKGSLSTATAGAPSTRKGEADNHRD